MCFRYETGAAATINRFLIAEKALEGRGKEAVAAAKQAEPFLASFAAAVCRVQVEGTEVLQSGFFFSSRRAVTGIHFPTGTPVVKGSKVHFTLMDNADAASFQAHLWHVGQVVDIVQEQQVLVFEAKEDHPFIPISDFSFDLTIGDLVGCIGYHCIPSASEVNSFWLALDTADRKIVEDVKWKPTPSDVELQTLPEKKIISPGKVSELIEGTPVAARITSCLYYGSTCGLVLKFRGNARPSVVGRVEGTVWQHHLNLVHVMDQAFVDAIRAFL